MLNRSGTRDLLIQETRHEAGADASLLYLQLVFALFAGMLNVPLDLVGKWLTGEAPPPAIAYTEFHLLSALVFAVITFCAWRWIIPHLRGVLVLRLLVQMMLGIVMFGYGLFATAWLDNRLAGVVPHFTTHVLSGPSAAFLMVVGGATLYMILGGLSLGSASREHSRLRELALRGQLEALRSQLNHHFLFNSLNVIAEAAAVQPERAEKLILQLAGVLRYSLGASRARMAPLSEELAAVASYLELERARSGDRISIESDIASDVGGVSVPPMLIQPLVENAVEHGLLNGTCKGKITISAWLNDNTLCLRVSDNGVGFDPDRSPRADHAGVGLSNLRERLRAFYGDKAAFHLHSSVDAGGTVGEISLPRALRADTERVEHGFIWRTFFSSVGSIASVLAFAAALEIFKLDAAWSILIGEATEVIYLFAAGAIEETKTFDVAMVMFFFAGQIALSANCSDAFLAHAVTLLCISCAAVAIVPQLIAVEPFTPYWMRRAYPLWLQRGASFERIARQIAMLWGAVFIALAVASIRWPAAFAMSPAYIAMIGLMVGPLSSACPSWLIHRAGLNKASAEFFILGLPLMFRRNMESAPDLAARFVVSGAEPGTYYVDINQGRCTSGQGDLKDPSLTIYCSTDSWNRVGRGELTAEQALAGRLLRITGSAENFSQFFQCFNLAKPRGASRAMSARGLEQVEGANRPFRRSA
jgi:signal transduction histidine kinase